MRQHLLPSALALTLTLVPLAACSGGGGDPAALTQEGYAALSSSDWGTAADKLDAAVDGLPPGDPKHLQAQVGLCRALAHVDSGRCPAEFDALVKAHSDKVQMGDVETIVKELTDAGAFVEATEVLSTAQKTFPESPKVAALVKEVGDKASKSGQGDAAMDKLRGMGYVGD